MNAARPPDDADELYQALLRIDRIAARRLVVGEAGAARPPGDATRIVTRALERIGSAWERGEVALSQIYMAGRICERLIEEILPLDAPGRLVQPKLAIVTLADHHPLGRRIVLSQLRSLGYALEDWGRLEVEALVERVRRSDVACLLVSTLMLPSALEVRRVREGIDRWRPEVRLIVGGAPFNMDRDLWRAVGADAMGRDGEEAAEIFTAWTEVPR